MKNEYYGFMIIEDDIPKSFWKFKNEARGAICGTRADNVKQIWIKKVKIQVVEEQPTAKKRRGER